MSKIKTLTLALGITTCSVFAALPIVPVFADDPAPEAEKTLDIDINVANVISMTLDHNSTNTTILPNSADLTTMFTNIYVSTNSPEGYTLTLADADNNANLQTAFGATIAPISSEPAGGSNPGWAVRIDGESTWQAMPTQSSGNVITVKNYSPSPKAVTVNDHSEVFYGVAASTNQATGTYTDTVTYTATAK